MEKLQQLTAYDEFADRAGIIDKYTFLQNMKLLADYDEKYRDLLNGIIEMENTYIEIEQNLSFVEWKSIIGKIYRVTGGLSFLPLYHIVCDYTGTKIQEYIDYGEMEQVVYNLYISNYAKFIELVKQVITPSGRNKWRICIPTKPEEKPAIDYSIIPKVPEVPKLK